MRKLAFPEDLPAGLEALKMALPDHKALNDAEEVLLVLLYDTYEAAGGRADLLEPNPTFEGARGDDLREAYKQTHSRRKLAFLRTRLRTLVANRCPSCGGSRPAHLDHHAPKAKFAEFSLNLKNLVCACEGCNGKKNAHVASDDSEAFLHPYFDDIPDIPYVAVNVEVGAAVTASLAFDDAAPIPDPLMKARMKHQFDKVDVNLQLAGEITETITEEADTIDTEHPDGSPQDVHAYLLRRAGTLARRHGKAFWKAALVQALAHNAAFCLGGYRLMLKKPALATAEAP